VWQEGQQQLWEIQFAQERDRLFSLLGRVPDGGVIERIEHIGATSVAGLPARPCVDIALAVWPFPLTPQHYAALETLGYTIVDGYTEEPEQRFRHAGGGVQLFVAEAGSQWRNHLVVRDYLRHNEMIRQVVAARKEGWWAARLSSADEQATKAALFQELLPQAQVWWMEHFGFVPVQAIARELSECPHAWYISSGWALDLFLGRVTRVHEDVDVVVARTDQSALQQYMIGRGWKWVTPFDGRLERWPSHMILQLPRHQAHAHREDAFIDFLLTDIEHGVWRYRRDPVVIRSVERMSLLSAEGIPILAPELVLLFKSKNTGRHERSKDQADFEQVYPHLGVERRAWLRWALLVVDPDHPWIELLR
jgi:GrpB-like predicted nucleotidyltransferase (UPF0157 family)